MLKSKSNKRIVTVSGIHITGYEKFQMPKNCNCKIVLHEQYGYIYFTRFPWQSIRDGISLSLAKITNIRRTTEQEMKKSFSMTDYIAVADALGSAAGMIFATKNKPVKRNIFIIEYVSNGRKGSVVLKEKDGNWKLFETVLNEILSARKKSLRR